MIAADTSTWVAFLQGEDGLAQLPLIEIEPGYWQRAGAL